MSLIHEALKKAEEQRRLGQPPDLTTPFTRPRERQPILPFLLVAIVIAAGTGWWLLRAPPMPPATTSASTGSSAKPTTSGPQKLAGPQDSANVGGMEHTAARSSSAERQPVVQPPPALPGAVAPPPTGAAPKPLPMSAGASKLASGEPVATSPDSSGPQGREKTMPPGGADQAKPDPEALARAMNKAAPVATTPLNAATKPTGPVKVSKVPIPDTSPTMPATAPATSPVATNTPAAPVSEVASGAKKAELPDTEPVTGPALTPPPPTSAAGATVDNLPMFWQLPYGTRKDLPQLTMSMHVYASDPGKRFIVINGDHKAEGDPVGADLFVREIRSDGVVMEFRGQRFLVPRGGS